MLLGDRVYYWSKTHQKFFAAFVSGENKEGTVDLYVLFNDVTATYTTQKATFVSYVKHKSEAGEGNYWITHEEYVKNKE